MNNKDENFKKFCVEVEKNYKLISQLSYKSPSNDNPVETLASSVVFYEYTAKEKETFFSLSSRFNVGQETLATINHIATPQDNLAGKKLLIPNCKGLFLTENSKTSFETLLNQKKGDTKASAIFVLETKNNKEKFFFYPDYQVGMTERAFFLDSSLRMPLEKSVLTSEFGMRISPISGKPLFHNGVDLAAPEGTNVLSCGSGTVERVGKDNIYGNFIEIKHPSGKYSFYAHLSKVEISTGDFVHSGQVIGQVGVTGLTTGPHLHFEIRQDNKKIDPMSVVG